MSDFGPQLGHNFGQLLGFYRFYRNFLAIKAVSQFRFSVINLNLNVLWVHGALLSNRLCFLESYCPFTLFGTAC